MVRKFDLKRAICPFKDSNQTACQADGSTPLSVVGEIHIILSRGSEKLVLDALVVHELDVDVLGGVPFMTKNDIAIRPAKQLIVVNDKLKISYANSTHVHSNNSIRRTQAFTLRADSCTPKVTWPGSYVELDIPNETDPDAIFAVEPKFESNGTATWPAPQLVEAIDGKIRIVNSTADPIVMKRHEHVCQARLTIDISDNNTTQTSDNVPKSTNKKTQLSNFSSTVSLDPDNILSGKVRQSFESVLTQYDDVFNDKLTGYNGASGPFKSVVNMGPVQPPQRKGRLPLYSRDKLVDLQEHFDILEKQGVFARPEDVGITVEYLNPSFLVKKPQGGYRLVTAFADVGRYAKPQPSLMPDVDTVLRNIGQWHYLIKTDLTSAFYQIPLSKESMKYCGVVTPFRGVRVYTRCAMGMPGSETALEELTCRVFGDLLQEGIVVKLADDLYCGGDTPDELLLNWSRVLAALQRNNLKLKPSKTVICPKSTTILGWIWSQGTLSASPHRLATLSTCPVPETVKGLRSFIGAYKVLGRVLESCSQIIAPLDDSIAGMTSNEKIVWSENSLNHFHTAQKSLKNHKSIVIPNTTDQLWIVTDGSVKQHGVGATLYVGRNDKLHLAGFFSAKLRKHQVLWLPCEIEALSIASAVKHFSPYIIQSGHRACVLTDSKPCVQAIEKLRRGEFSASPRVTSFLTIVSRFQMDIKHLAGSANVPSDFASRNAPTCSDLNCQICSFILRTEDSVVRAIHTGEILNNYNRLPFTTRSAWKDIQSSCPDLRRVHAQLSQGTRPSKKITDARDIKRYLGIVTIAKDGLLVVKHTEPLSIPVELIVVPRSAIDGLLTALHIKLSHPTKHQLSQVLRRHFYALDITQTVEKVTDSCHECASLRRFPRQLLEQSSEDPPEAVGVSFAADIMKRNRQLILVLRETSTSYTAATLISDEKANTVRESLVCLITELHPLHGPSAVVRVDPGPCFVALKEDDQLKRLNINLDIGRVKNPNKNPVAEKAILELGDEMLRVASARGVLSKSELAIAVAQLNSRIRREGLSSRELWTQRSQYTHEQLPICDRDLINNQHEKRLYNHRSNEKTKSRNKISSNQDFVEIGDLVYLYSDKNKIDRRQRYLVVKVIDDWLYVKKFVGNQLRNSSYKVKRSECFKVASEIQDSSHYHNNQLESSDTESEDIEKISVPDPIHTPSILTMAPAHESSGVDTFDASVDEPAIQDQGGNEPDIDEPGFDLSVDEPAIHGYDGNEPDTEKPGTKESDANEPDTRNVGPRLRPQRKKRPPPWLSDFVT